MTLHTVFLWLYSAVASLVFGATIYEALVVHPAWSRKPPESFVAFMGTPVGRMNLAAFWIPVVPLFALSAVASVAVAAMRGTPNLALIASAACAVIAVVWAIMAWGRTGRREPGWIDRMGRMLGYLWLALFVLTLVQPPGP